jgi:hypothetical protein
MLLLLGFLIQSIPTGRRSSIGFAKTTVGKVSRETGGLMEFSACGSRLPRESGARVGWIWLSRLVRELGLHGAFRT